MVAEWVDTLWQVEFQSGIRSHVVHTFVKYVI